MNTRALSVGIAVAACSLSLSVLAQAPAGAGMRSAGTPTNQAKTQATAPAPAEAAPTPAGAAATASPPALNVPAAPAKSAAGKEADAKAEADKEKRELAARMDRVAERWRKRAAAEGWRTNAPTPTEPLAGFNASAAQSSASGQPGGVLGSAARDAPIRSEKRGTAPPSEDVKKPKTGAAR